MYYFRDKYLENVQQIEGYGEIFFPHCASDARKDGHIIAIVGINAFKLQACKEDGTPEVVNWRSKSNSKTIHSYKFWSMRLLSFCYAIILFKLKILVSIL